MKNKFRSRLLTLIVPLLAAVVIGWWMMESPHHTSATTQLTPSPVKQASTIAKPVSAAAVTAPKDDVQVQIAFRSWMDRFQSASPDKRADLVPEGRVRLEERQSRMVRLIRENPEQALRDSLKFHEYDLIPAELRGLVERPFSTVASYDCYPICGAPAGFPEQVAELDLENGRHDTFTFGTRAAMVSKSTAPVNGITLGGAAAMHESALRLLDNAEITTAQRLFPMGNEDATKSFLTGEPLTNSAVTALGGGKIYHFASVEELDTVNQALAKLDEMPGPSAGSDVLYEASPAASGSGGFNLAKATESQQAQADAWTENPKNVFLIRVDFSNNTGLAFSQNDTSAVLNGAVSDQIRAMSYGKTSIIAAVSQNVYRMPSASTVYVGAAAESLNNNLLRDARNTFRNTKSGGDASINIGPVNNTAPGGGVGGLGNYDIVGVLFSSIGMKGGGIVYSGFAGGTNMWMQGNINAATFTHEFGHNYGLAHSSFWNTNGTAALNNTGTSEEYGDLYDIMGDGQLPNGHFHAQAKAKLNWLTTSEWRDANVGGSATHRIHRIDSQFTTGTPRGVRITRAGSPVQYLWLSYRPSYNNIPFLERGAYLSWQRPSETRSWLVDTTPTTIGVKTDAAIRLGATFADATSSSFITPIARGGSGAETWLDVRVNIGTFPGNAAPTAPSIVGAASVVARTSNAFSVVAADANADTLAYSWDTGDGNVPDNASSISHAWVTGGNFTLNLTVSDMKGGTRPLTKSITVTDPLDTWTSGTVGSSQTLNELLYAKGRYLTAAFTGLMYLSWDGVTWSNVGSPPDIDQPKLAFGANVFVAAGIKESATSTAQITWSNDGRRWNQATLPNGVPFVRDVAFGGGKFAAVCEDGAVLSSTDGKTWEINTVPTFPDFRKIAWAGTRWVAAAQHPTFGSSQQVIWTSPDAVTWTERPSLGFEVYQFFYAAGKTYAIGWYGGIYCSTDDGLTWTSSIMPGTTRWSTFLMAAAEDGTLLCTARAMDEPGTPYAQLVSQDGLRWYRATGNTTVAENADALVWGAGRFLTVEDAGVTRRSNSFYPSNAAPSANFTTAPATGNAREPILLAASATDPDNAQLTYAWDFGTQVDVQDGFEISHSFSFGGPYVTTLRVIDNRGGVASINYNINVIDPARTFTDRSVTSAVGDLQAVAASSTRVVAVGTLFSGSFSGPSIYSTDGTTWNTANAGPNRQLYAIAHDGTQFIGCGMRYAFDINGWRSWIGTSTDGAVWTERYFAGTSAMRAVAVGGGSCVAAGEQGSVLRSTDGTTWTPIVIPEITTSVTFEGLAWNGSLFVLTGYSGVNGVTKVFTSSYGLTWTDQSSGSGVANWQDLRKTAWLNDRFVSSGWYSKVRFSTNNGTSFSSNRSDSEETTALAYGGGVYFAAGINRDATDADIDLLSLNGSEWFSYAAPTTTNRRAATYFNRTFITVGDAGSIWQSATLVADSGFALWQNANFANDVLLALPDRDPDFDGIANIAEYALGLVPTAANGSPTSAVVQEGRTWFHFDIPQPTPADVRYVIQGSTSLQNAAWNEIARKTGTGAWVWSADGTPRITLGTLINGKIPVDIGTPDSQVTQPRYFMRLEIDPF